MTLEAMFDHLSTTQQEAAIAQAQADMDLLPDTQVDEACRALGVETGNKKSAATALAAIREAVPVLIKLGLLVLG